MTWELDHANLAHKIRGDERPDTLSAAQARDSTVVRAAIAQTVTELLTNRRGGTLYVPHVEGDELWIDVSTGSLRIPPEVEVVVAPGVVLVPVHDGRAGASGNRLEIAGVLRAPLGTIFATPGWFGRRGGASRASLVASVALTSRRMERVHPEWWGAADAADGTRASDNEAIEAALHAATRERWSEDGGARHRLPTLPVELRGSYALSRPLVLDDPAGAYGNGFELRGAGTATLQCNSLFPRDRAMIEVAASVESVALEDLRFEGMQVALNCLAIRDAGGAATSREHLARRCSFTGSRGALVSFYDARLVDEPSTADPAAQLLDRTSVRLRVEHSRFEPIVALPDAPVGLDLAAPPDVVVDIRGSFFAGSALAMVHARSCALSLANCHFRNDQIPLRMRVEDPDSALHRDGPEGGVDVFLDSYGAVPVGTLYAQDCRSNSVQFLATVAGVAAAQGDSTIVGLQHSRSSVVWAPGAAKRVAPEAPLQAKPPIWVVFEPTPALPDAVASKAFDAKAPQAKVAVGLIDPVADTKGALIARLPERQRLDPNVLEGPAKFPIAKGPGTPDTDPPERRFVAPVHWHLSAKLTLIGCRFSAPSTHATPFVEGFGGSGDIIDLSVVARNDTATHVRVATPRRHVTVRAIGTR